MITLNSNSTNQIRPHVLEDMGHRTVGQRGIEWENRSLEVGNGVHVVRKAESEVDEGDLVAVR